jgi:NAD-dependent deacetylase sirtuin 4
VLCIGTSLAVHSAYRLVKRAIDKGTEVAILNVGETRIESEGLNRSTGLVCKIESPICETLAELVKRYDSRAIEE